MMKYFAQGQIECVCVIRGAGKFGIVVGAAVQLSPKLQATTAPSCVEIRDSEEAAMELSSEEDKVPTDLTAELSGLMWVGWMKGNWRLNRSQ
jgi:FAD/FMN-containing dehydrogenase